VAKLYKGSSESGASNAKTSGKRSSGIAVPYQPVRGGAKVLGSRKAARASKGGTFKLEIKPKK
jgi:hypothetical protein